MTITVTFGGYPVSVLQKKEVSVDAPFSETTLLSGETYIQASSTTKFARSYECYTEDFTEITALLGLIGTKQTLVINGTSYTNCYLKPPLAYEELIEGSGKYTYTISFVRHSA